MKFGYEFKGDQPKLKLRNYMGPELPPPPVAVDWTLAISEDLGMMGNDTVGLCTCADVGHVVMLLTAMGDGIVKPTTAEVVALYMLATGYNPKDPSTDRGASLTEIASYVQKTGFIVGEKAHKIHAYLDIDKTGSDAAFIQHIKQAIYLFKHCSIGFSVPASAIDAFQAGETWTNYRGKVVGGHDVPLVAYDTEGAWCFSWGRMQKGTWDFWLNTADEVQARLYDDAAGDGWDEGFNMAQLEKDLPAIA